MELLEHRKAMKHPWRAACRGKADTIRNQLTHPEIARPASHPTCLDAPAAASSLSHRASDTRVSGIIRNFHLELPDTVQYTFTRYFSNRKSALLQRSQ
jgi:hypothetical protein